MGYMAELADGVGRKLREKPGGEDRRGPRPLRHSGTISGYRGRCVKSVAPSFRNISRQYFQKEARRDFVGEAIVFAMLIITATVAVAAPGAGCGTNPISGRFSDTPCGTNPIRRRHVQPG